MLGKERTLMGTEFFGWGSGLKALGDHVWVRPWAATRRVVAVLRGALRGTFSRRRSSPNIV